MTPHGSRTRYNRHHCRCAPCTRAHADYNRDYARGVRRSIPSAPVGAHLNALLEAGWTLTALAAHLGYDRGNLRKIATGRNQWTGVLMAEDILSVPVKVAA